MRSSLRFDRVHSARSSARLPGAAWRVNGELPVTVPVTSTVGLRRHQRRPPRPGLRLRGRAHTGLLRWSTGGGISSGTWPLVAGDRVIVALQGGELVALDARTGADHWIIETGGVWETGPVLAGGVLYAAPSTGVTPQGSAPRRGRRPPGPVAPTPPVDPVGRAVGVQRDQLAALQRDDHPVARRPAAARS